MDRVMAAGQLASTGPVKSGSQQPQPNQSLEVLPRKIYTEIPAAGLLFSKHVEDVEGPLELERQSGKSKGFALFISKSVEGAREALEEPIKNLDGHQLYCQKATDTSKLNATAAAASAHNNRPSGPALPSGFTTGGAAGFTPPDMAAFAPLGHGLLSGALPSGLSVQSDQGILSVLAAAEQNPAAFDIRQAMPTSLIPASAVSMDAAPATVGPQQTAPPGLGMVNAYYQNMQAHPDELLSVEGNDSICCHSSNEFISCASNPRVQSTRKKRKICSNAFSSSHLKPCNGDYFLPILHSSGYFMEPSLSELTQMEFTDMCYCQRVKNFTVGRVGYGRIKFLGETDVRCLDLDQIVKFDRHEVIVYEDENKKPVIGQGLNKAAEVTLLLQMRFPVLDSTKCERIEKKLRRSTERQGAKFISFDACNGEWKFLVPHFSRFALTEDDEEDIVMEDVVVQQPGEPSGTDRLDVDEGPLADSYGNVLSHSLPAHLGLDPVKMQEMRMLMFPVEEQEEEERSFLHEKKSQVNSSKNVVHRPSLHYTSQKFSNKVSPSAQWNSPIPLLGYNTNRSDSNPPKTILMTGQNKDVPVRMTKVGGFKLETNYETPLTNSHSKNVVDAALFMGRSFRVGWGPNGLLVHCGTHVNNSEGRMELSSIIKVEKVAFDKVVRDENKKVKVELVNCYFDSPLNLHKSMHHETVTVDVGSFNLKLQKLVSNRFILPVICRSYIDVVEGQLDVMTSSLSSRLQMMHQVMIWELMKVLFSAKEVSGQQRNVAADDNGEDMVHDRKDTLQDTDPDAYPLIRRAGFSYWLQESVCHRVQEEVSCLDESNDLEHIFLLLTGRQLDAAVELAASRGDVRLACLLSQAGGSMVNRYDMAQQLNLWRINGLDFNFIENGRLRLYEILAGNIHGALDGSKLDWKRVLGLLMWYQLPPDAPLPFIINTFQQLLNEEKAPLPVPIYIDEGPTDEAPDWQVGDRFDLAYYLMLLHANEDKACEVLKTMLSSFSSTNDVLDYHMIWHQRAVLEAVGAFTSNDLHILDMSFVSQLLSVGLYHWAIYVVLHMPYRTDFPFLQANIIREILFQYCELWSKQEIQWKFIEDLGIPSEWLHEALAVYFQYYGHMMKALEHFLECAHWQSAHSIFITSVAHLLFSTSKHSEIWRLATIMEVHRSEIADWDLGAGIYIDYYTLKSSLQEENGASELDSLEKISEECRKFFSCLNDSIIILGSKLPLNARAVYSKMAEELCSLLLSYSGEGSTCEVQMNSFDVMLSAPIPEDIRACHLQNAVSVFTCFLSETAT